MAKVVAFAALVVVLLMVGSCGLPVSALGVNWGTQADNPMPPADVVKLMQLNGITKVKIFDANYDVVRSMAGTGIEVMVAAPNDLLYNLANDASAAAAWVKQNVTQFLFQGGVDIKWVAVGNEPFLTAYNNSYLNTTYPALLNIQTALDNAGHSEVKAIVPFNADVLTDSSLPSNATFKPEYMSQIALMLAVFNRTGAPFSVNLYPYISLYQNPNYPISYAFFNGTTSPVVDGAITYQNALDASLDGLYTALKVAGYPNMAVMLGEIGWPTDGAAPYATIEYAGLYMNQLIQHLQSNVGTPLRPNTNIEFYLFSLLDENAKSILPGPFERHWGVFYYDGIPKYPLNLASGTSNAATELKNLPYPPYMTAQFCVLDTSVTDLTNLTQNVQYACENADCTALNPGSTCSGLANNASYAFNSYYQAQSQNVDACYFQGYAKISTTNPSQGQCRFELSLVHTSTTSAAATLRFSSGLLALTLLASFLLTT